jgi:hypothetical protein
VGSQQATQLAVAARATYHKQTHQFACSFVALSTLDVILVVLIPLLTVLHTLLKQVRQQEAP